MPEKPINPNKIALQLAKHGLAEKLRMLLDAAPSLLHVTDADGSTLLHCAAWKGHFSAVEVLLDYGADVMAQNSNEHYGGTPLHAAAHANHKPIAALLIERGADVNAVSCNGRTPLQETA